MANPEHVEVVKQGVGAIKAWREANPRVRLDLEGADLHGMELVEADLRGANLSQSDLHKSNLLRAKLSPIVLNEDLISRREMEQYAQEVQEQEVQEQEGHYKELSLDDLRGIEINFDEWFEVTNLNGADLRNANLEGADLRQAHLVGAKLGGADLFDARLDKADLRGVNLVRADLRKANLYMATLDRADLDRVDLGATMLLDIDLSKVKGLETCRHECSSTLDSSTLSRSDPLPRAFLRGCGLHDWEIEATKLYQKGLQPGQITDITYHIRNLLSDPLLQFYSAFISYTHADSKFARQLHDTLQKRGIRCWLDEKQLLPGDDLMDQIDRGIRLWDKVILCCSKAALQYSAWVKREVNKALQKEERLQRERGEKVLALIPLDLDGALFKWEDGAASELKARYITDFTKWEDDDAFTAQVDRVVRALQVAPEGHEPPPPRRL